MPTFKILAFAGSTRRESFNRKFLAVAVNLIREAGVEVTLVDLRDYALPIYDGDLEDESGLPAAAKELAALIAGHDGLLVASPEYNAMITPLLKNTIDWCSLDDRKPFPGRVAAVISASPGAFGGIRSLQMAQALLLKQGCHVVPGQCALPHADKAFGPDGQLLDPRTEKSVRALTTAFVSTLRQMHPGTRES